MTADAGKETLMIRYLLGELSPEARADFERRFFTEPGFLDSLEVVEEQIIRDALTGELPAEYLNRFQDYFLSFPEHRRKFEATKSLREALAPAAVAPSPQPIRPIQEAESRRRKRTSLFRKAIALAAGVTILILGLDDVRLHWSGPNGSITPLTLEPGLTRRGGNRQVRLTLSAGALLVRVTAKIERTDYHGTFRAILRAVDMGKETVSLTGMPAQPAGAYDEVTVEIPASNLSESFYTLTLGRDNATVFEPMEAYSFQVLHTDKQ